MCRHRCVCVSHKPYMYIAMHIYAVVYFVAISGFRPPLFHFNSLSTYTIQSSFKMSMYRRLCAREKEGGEGREGDIIYATRAN